MKTKIYELTVFILALISVVFAFIDFSKGLSSWMAVADKFIYAFFITDYFVRFFISKNKKDFVKSNVFDLIAILPFSSALRIFRTAKLFRVLKIARLAKLTRLFAFVGRFGTKCKKFLNTNGFKYILIICVLFVLSGGVLISIFEGMSIPDGLWWAFVTATTVGYGDISPTSTPGRLIACILMLCGIGLVGALTSTITTYFLADNSNQEEISSDKVHMALSLYDELNDMEKSEFKKHLD